MDRFSLSSLNPFKIISMADKKESTQILSTREANWSQVPTNLSAIILSKLSLVEKLMFKAVCPSWYKAVKDHRGPPLLLLGQNNNDSSVGNDGFRFYSLQEKKVRHLKVYNLKNKPVEELLAHNVCLGSSHGWLLLLNKELEFRLLDLLGLQLIALPPLNTFPDILECNLKDVGERVRKAVLSSRPTCLNKNKIGVMVLYSITKFQSCRFHLAFCTTADHEWTKLNEHRWYIDVTSYENQYYALRDDYSTIEVWDFPGSFPIKKEEIRADASMLGIKTISPSCTTYIIKTVEDVLLIQREISACYTSDDSIPFQVYKMSLDGRWIEVESIGNRALALGLNQSIVISSHDAPRCKEGSIYFTSQLPHGNSFGVFNLRDKKVKKVPNLATGTAPVFWVDHYLF